MAHYDPQTEEIYYILNGRGRMEIDQEVRDVGPGDAVAIPPGATHRIRNIGEDTLTLLCCCVPAYEHEDMMLVESSES